MIFMKTMIILCIMVWLYGINHANQTNQLCKSVVQTIGVSARETLEKEIAYNEAQINQLNNFAVDYYFTNGDSAQAMSILITSDNYEDKKLLSEIYLSNNDYAACADALVEVLNTAESEKVEDAVAYYEYMTILINLAEQNKTIFELTQEQEQAIRTIASGNTATAFSALAVLETVFDEQFEYPVLKFNTATVRSLKVNNNTLSTNNVYYNSNEFNLYPNPASDNIVFEYNASNYAGSIIEIYDNISRKVFEHTLTGNDNKIVIKTKELENGVYHYVVKDNNVIVYQNQFVIIK
ncbi:MAG TPA: hypothetical protein DDX39_12010 [Bacteroidales bacterium]|nr:hypothetical protein [Bacteroidales bacterium]